MPSQEPIPDRDVLVVAYEGTVDERNADVFLGEVNAAIDAGTRRVVLDCSKLRYISSYGLGILVRVHKRLVERDGEIALACASDRLMMLLHLVRLDGIFANYPSVDEARRALRDPPRP